MSPARTPSAADPSPATKYAALSSVWQGSAGELLDAMLRFYPAIDPHPILDTTYNTGRIWRESTWGRLDGHCEKA